MSIYCQCFIQWCICRGHQEKCSLIFFSLYMMFMAFDVNNKVRIELLANTCMFLCKTFDKKIPRFFKTEKMKSVTEVPGT